MNIQVLGSGCPTCKKLYEVVKQTLVDMHLNLKVEYSTDIQQMVSMGVMQSPVLAINGKPVMTGFSSDRGRIREIIEENLASEEGDHSPNQNAQGCCSGKDICDVTCKPEKEGANATTAKNSCCG